MANIPQARTGTHTLTVNFDGTPLETFTYRPSGPINGVLLNFHGSGRNAEGARDAAIKMADAYGLYVVSPKFEKDDFSTNAYQMGGLTDSRGRLLPEDARTVGLIDDIATWAHARVGGGALETIGFGHSAGGQFLSRAAAFGPDVFDKIIIANPSTHIRASLSESLPYGFKGLPAPEAEAALRAYLAQPITLYAGGADNDPRAADLARGSAAMRQGDNRLERAEFVFVEAQKVAQANGWEFNWEMVVAKGVGHSARQMFNAPEFAKAFDGRVDDGPGLPAQPTPQPHVFDFDRTSEWNGTVITTYKDGDIFDFSDIDANTSRRGDQDFDLLGFAPPSAFTSASAQIRLRHHDGDTYIYLNTDRDGYYEARGIVEGIHHFTADDFIL